MYIAFDPGDRWTGIAVLLPCSKRLFQATSMVVDGEEFHYFAARLLEQVAFSKVWPVTVIAEDYRVRPVGHQRWTRGTALRLLGVIEYLAMKNTWPQYLEPPAEPEKQLKLLGISSLIAEWRKSWPQSRDSSWGHALSAWRVLGQHLLRYQPDLLQSIRLARILDKDGSLPARLASSRLAVSRFACDLDDHDAGLYSPNVLWGTVT